MYPNETLKLFEFKSIESKSEYYFLTQTKISNLYMYYLLNDKGEKAVFKNPHLLDKLSLLEREQRMVLRY
jgi:hypothetical protein